MTRLCLGLLVLLTGRSLHAADVADRWQAARVPTLVVASIVVFLLAVFASSRVPARRSTGRLFGFLSTLVIAVSVIALAIMFPATAPDLGFDAYLYYVFYIYVVLPHLALVGIIAMSLIGGTASRLRVFAVTLGGLTPVLVRLSVVSYALGA